MKTSINKPKRSPGIVARQPKTTQVSGPQQAQGIPCPKLDRTVKPANKDIAKRAYEIYVENGCLLGQCERNWEQAEQELTKGLKIVSA